MLKTYFDQPSLRIILEAMVDEIKLCLLLHCFEAMELTVCLNQVIMSAQLSRWGRLTWCPLYHVCVPRTWRLCVHILILSAPLNIVHELLVLLEGVEPTHHAL